MKLRSRRIHLRNNRWLSVHLTKDGEYRYLDVYTGFRVWEISRDRAQELLQLRTEY